MPTLRIGATVKHNDEIEWIPWSGGVPGSRNELAIAFSLGGLLPGPFLLEKVQKTLDVNGIRWLTVYGQKGHLNVKEFKQWLFASTMANHLEKISWLDSDSVEEYWTIEYDKFSKLGISTLTIFTHYDIPKTSGRSNNIPLAIQDSLEEFKSHYPDPSNVAFIMCRFGKEKPLTTAITSIKETLKTQGITGIRADDRTYHEDLYYNILTYIYGCGFGIAVYDRLINNEFNPNVAFEVGYMKALGKRVCLLKDQTLTALHADLQAKLYSEFDTTNSRKSIRKVLEKWLKDKGT